MNEKDPIKDPHKGHKTTRNIWVGLGFWLQKFHRNNRQPHFSSASDWKEWTLSMRLTLSQCCRLNFVRKASNYSFYFECYIFLFLTAIFPLFSLPKRKVEISIVFTQNVWIMCTFHKKCMLGNTLQIGYLAQQFCYRHFFNCIDLR